MGHPMQSYNEIRGGKGRDTLSLALVTQLLPESLPKSCKVIGHSHRDYRYLDFPEPCHSVFSFYQLEDPALA